MNTTLISILADRELSLKARIGYVALLLASLAMSAVVGSLWLTEEALESRTIIAFALMTTIGLSWAVYAIWVLASRKVLLAFQAVVAARMAVLFCSLAFVGAMLVAIFGDKPAAWVAAVTFALMLITAALMLMRARRRLHELMVRRKELERQIDKT